jgi:ATP-dependent DNA ligase
VSHRSGPGRLHEIKHDGFRIMARRDSAGIQLITRNGNVSLVFQRIF